MNVVSNTSPLADLTLIGQLDLLAQLYGSLTIQDADLARTRRQGETLPTAQQIAPQASWHSTVGDEPGAGAVTAS